MDDASRVLPNASLPHGWTIDHPAEENALEITELLRGHERAARGWPTSTAADVLVDVSARGHQTRQNVVLHDQAGRIRGWASAHDRAAGRLLLTVVVDRGLEPGVADRVAAALFAWGEREAHRVGAARGIVTQQIDSGAFEGDEVQQRWLSSAGFAHVRTWWQMTREVTEADRALDIEPGPRVRIRLVRRDPSGMPVEDDLRTVHDVLENAFADHFNSHEETFDEFVARLREDPGHRWDHWWIAELVEEHRAEAAGALVGSVSEGEAGTPDGSYVEYIGVLQKARGRGVAKSLLFTVIADAAQRGRARVGLEVDADSPTGADSLYVSLGWRTQYVTESWHKVVTLQPAVAACR